MAEQHLKETVEKVRHVSVYIAIPPIHMRRDTFLAVVEMPYSLVRFAPLSPQAETTADSTFSSSHMATVSLKILLIEDDPVIADLMHGGLESAGHSVVIASKGAVGRKTGKTGLWDLLIVDRLLPDVDGLTIVKQLRSMSIDTPIIFTTTMDSVADRVAGLEGGADDYLVKPFAMEESNCSLVSFSFLNI